MIDVFKENGKKILAIGKIEDLFAGRSITRAIHTNGNLDGIERTIEAMKTAKNLQKGKFDLEDFLSTLKQIKKLGPLENLIKMIPGAKKMGLNDVKVNPKDLAHIEAIVLSMTPHERRHPEILKAQRKQRIAKGSGRSVEEVNRLLKQFDQMKLMMKSMKNGKMPF